jgi:hypothetical protein
MGMIYIDGVPEEYTGKLDDYTERNIHREDGPAIEWDDGCTEWRVRGQRHRIDGPAVEWLDGTRYWCLNGVHWSFNDFLKQLPEEDAVLLALAYKT